MKREKAIKPKQAKGWKMLIALVMVNVIAATASLAATRSERIDQLVAEIEGQVIAWQRDIHQHPELGNREFRTAALVAKHLNSLGYQVTTGVAHTGVVAVLKGGQPGPVLALRADMDALPITEQLDVAHASKVISTWNGTETGVMHACGHDAHVAILMGVAKIFSQLQSELPGTVKLIFQPAEEGAPKGEEGGAKLMLKEGVFNSPSPEAIFALHVSPDPAGHITYTPGGALASADSFSVTVTGKGTHGAQPWGGKDPIVAASQLVMAIQNIVSRQTNLLTSPAVITIGSINGGNAGNVIPDKVVMTGTIRALDSTVRKNLHQNLQRTAKGIAVAADVEIDLKISEHGYPVTYNNPKLAEKASQLLADKIGQENVYTYPPITGAEDFSFFVEEIPGFYFYLGVAPEQPDKVFYNHSPKFMINEKGLKVGVKALVEMVFNYKEKLKL